MATTIKLKRSAVPGNVPTTAQLQLGEIAINTYDGKLYIKKDTGTESIVLIGPAAPAVADPGSNGIVVRTSSTTSTTRTITGTTNQITVSNGDGTGGNPTISLSSDPVLPGTGAVTVPSGTTAQRPVSPLPGMIRYNSTTGRIEAYESSWGEIFGSSSQPLNQIVYGTGTGVSSSSFLQFDSSLKTLTLQDRAVINGGSASPANWTLLSSDRIRVGGTAGNTNESVSVVGATRGILLLGGHLNTTSTSHNAIKFLSTQRSTTDENTAAVAYISNTLTDGTSTTGGGLIFSTRPTSGSLTQRVFISDAGNVTINTPNSGTALTVNGITNTDILSVTNGTMNLVHYIDSSSTFIGTRTNHQLRLMTNATTRLTLATDGSITQSAPTANVTAFTINAFTTTGANTAGLQVNGNTDSYLTNYIINNHATGNAVLEVRGSASSIASFIGTFTSGNTGTCGTNTNHAFTLYTNNAGRMVISNNGNVTIYTPSAGGHTLTLSGTNPLLLDNQSAIQFKDSGGTSRTVVTMTSANNVQLQNGGATTGNIQIINTNASGVVGLYTNNGANYFQIDSAGNMFNTITATAQQSFSLFGGNNSFYRTTNNSAAANEKNWLWLVTPTSYGLRAYNDLLDSATLGINFVRSGNTITQTELYAGGPARVVVYNTGRVSFGGTNSPGADIISLENSTARSVSNPYFYIASPSSGILQLYGYDGTSTGVGTFRINSNVNINNVGGSNFINGGTWFDNNNSDAIFIRSGGTFGVGNPYFAFKKVSNTTLQIIGGWNGSALEGNIDIYTGSGLTIQTPASGTALTVNQGNANSIVLDAASSASSGQVVKMPLRMNVGSSNGEYPGIGYNWLPRNTSTWVYDASDHATRIQFLTDGFTFQSAGSGTAGTNITWTQVARLAASTGLYVGTSGTGSDLLCLYKGSAAATAMRFYQGGIAEWWYGMPSSSSTLTWGMGAGYGSTKLTLDSAGNLTAAGNVTAYSDKRLKTNIKPLENALEKVTSLTGVSFKRTDTNENGIGLIAQDVQQVFPEAVHEANDEQKTLSIAYGNLIGPLVEAIKELKAENDLLKQRINALEEKANVI